MILWRKRLRWLRLLGIDRDALSGRRRQGLSALAICSAAFYSCLILLADPGNNLLKASNNHVDIISRSSQSQHAYQSQGKLLCMVDCKLITYRNAKFPSNHFGLLHYF